MGGIGISTNGFAKRVSLLIEVLQQRECCIRNRRERMGRCLPYLLGKIGFHSVVIACLPAEKTGTVSAAIVAKEMLRNFKAVRLGFMVGIDGGAPYYGVADNDKGAGGDSEDEDSEDDASKDIRDIRLGDVVISLHSKSAEAVVQYNFGKSARGGEFIRTGTLNKPPNIVLGAVAMLQGQHRRKGHNISEHLSKMFQRIDVWLRSSTIRVSTRTNSLN